MPAGELLCVECGAPAPFRGKDGAPLCAEHARLDPDSLSVADLAAETPTVSSQVRPVSEAEASPPAKPAGALAPFEAVGEDLARRLPRELLAMVLSAVLAVVAGAIGAGIFYLAVGYFRGEGEALGGGYQSAAGVVAVVVAVFFFVLLRKTLSERLRRRR